MISCNNVLSTFRIILFKGTVSVNLTDPLVKDDNVRFTTIHLKALSDINFFCSFKLAKLANVTCSCAFPAYKKQRSFN